MGKLFEALGCRDFESRDGAEATPRYLHFFFKFSRSEDFKSIPSGHVSSAFALMTVIAKQYDHWYVEIPAYTFAVSIAFQRMTSRSHWASDTIVGGAIRYWVASTLVKKQRQPPKSPSLNFYPAGNRLSVALSF